MKKSERRPRGTREQWCAIVEAWRSSGCRELSSHECGLSASSLYYWSSMLPQEQAPARLIPVRVTSTTATHGAEFVLEVGRVRVRFDGDVAPAYVAALAHALLEVSAR